MNTNIPVLDPATAAAIQHLPPAWQGYATSLVLLALILGRLAASNTGLLGALKSVFMGSVHGTTTPVTASPASLNTSPATPPAAPAAVTVAKVSLVLLCIGSALWLSACSTSAVKTAYNTETAVDSATVAAWTLWQSYVTNAQIQGTPVSANTQTEVSAAFNKVKAAELVVIDATALAASTTNGITATTLASDSAALESAFSDLGTLLAQFKIKL